MVFAADVSVTVNDVALTRVAELTSLAAIEMSATAGLVVVSPWSTSQLNFVQSMMLVIDPPLDTPSESKAVPVKVRTPDVLL